jgi:WD40 repeat protein
MGADVDFYRDVYPILKSNCIACHNKTTHKAALNMESPESMRKGGDSGEGLFPGRSSESLIYKASAHLGEIAMPPKGNKSGAAKLTKSELSLLQTWIDQGAKASVKQERTIVWQALPPGVNPIYAVAITNDGRFAACGRANQVFLYDLATRQFLTKLSDTSLTSGKMGQAHLSMVHSLAFSPDGLRIASGGFREVKIWKREQELTSSHKPRLSAPALASTVSENGELVVTANNQGTLTLIAAKDGKILRSLDTKNRVGVVLLAISHDRSKIAVYTADGSLVIWSLNAASPERIASKSGLKGLRALAWSLDDKTIATGGDDKVVTIFSLATKLNTVHELKPLSASVLNIEFATNQIVARSADNNVTVWNGPDFKTFKSLSIPGLVASDLSEDGKLLAAGRGDGSLQIWDLTQGKPIADLNGDSDTNARLASLELAVASRTLETAFQKQEAARLEALNKGLEDLFKKATETIATIRKDIIEKQAAVKQANDSKDKSQQAVTTAAALVTKSASKPDPALQKSLKEAQDKFAAATMTESTALAALKAREIHLKDAEVESQNYKAAQSKNLTLIQAANNAAAQSKTEQDKANAETVSIRKAETIRKLRPLAVRLASEKQTVAAVFNDGSVRTWAIASGQSIRHFHGAATIADASLSATSDQFVAAFGSDTTIAHVGMRSSWTLERTIGSSTSASPFVDRVNALRFSPDGKTFAVGSGEPTRSGDISVWDVASGNLIREWKERHTDAVLSLDFSADGKKLASGGADKIARVTDVASGKVVNVLEGHTHHVLGVSFRSDGRVLGTSGADNSVIVWDMISGERKKKIEGWSKEVTSLQFIGATNQILTSSGDTQVRIVDDNGAQIRAVAKLPDFMQAAASATTAKTILAGGEDSLLRIWNTSTGQELATFGPDPTNTKSP